MSAVVKRLYTISYDANGGEEAPASQTKKHDEELGLSQNIPVKTGYKFMGWATSPSNEVVYNPGSVYAENANLVLYAVWQRDYSLKPFITNGNAESEEMSFYSSNGTVSRVQNPSGAGNVWLATPGSGKQWLYAMQDVEYVAGATYNVSAMVKVAYPYSATKILFNAVYTSSNGNRDHILWMEDISLFAGWKAISFTFTVPSDIIPSENEMFCLFTNPVDNVGVGCYFDNLNISVTLPN